MTDKATKATERFVSQREFARQAGISSTQVSRLIKQGKLPTQGTKVALNAGLAYMLEHGKTPPTQAASAKIPRHSIFDDKLQVTKAGDDDDSESADLAAELADLDREIENDPQLVFSKARAKEAVYKALQKKAEYEEQIGQLVPIEDIKEEASKVFAMARGELLAIPQRCAALLEGRTPREIEDILNTEINAALESFTKSKFN